MPAGFKAKLPWVKKLANPAPFPILGAGFSGTLINSTLDIFYISNVQPMCCSVLLKVHRCATDVWDTAVENCWGGGGKSRFCDFVSRATVTTDNLIPSLFLSQQNRFVTLDSCPRNKASEPRRESLKLGVASQEAKTKEKTIERTISRKPLNASIPHEMPWWILKVIATANLLIAILSIWDSQLCLWK